MKVISCHPAPPLEELVVLDLWLAASQEREVGVVVVRDHGHHPLTHSRHTWNSGTT